MGNEEIDTFRQVIIDIRLESKNGCPIPEQPIYVDVKIFPFDYAQGRVLDFLVRVDGECGTAAFSIYPEPRWLSARLPEGR